MRTIIWPTVKVRNPLCNPAVPLPDLTPGEPDPEPEPTFLSAQQTVSCEGGQALSATVALPLYYTIWGGGLVLEAGHIQSTISQADADTQALSEITQFFNAGIASGDLECFIGFFSAQQTVACPSADVLTASGALPDGVSIVGTSLVLAPGHSTSIVSQVAADAAALAYLEAFFAAAQGSGLLTCASLTDLATWWKADIIQGLPDGGRLDLWPDNTLLLNNLTAFPGLPVGNPATDTRPLYRTNIFGAMPAVQFNNIPPEPFMIMDSLLSLADYTVVAVLKQALNNDAIIVSYASANRQIRVNRANANRNSTFDGVAEVISTPSATPVTDARMVTFTRGTVSGVTTIAFYENSTALGTPVVGVSGAVHALNKVGAANFGNPLDGYIGELIIMTRAWTAGEVFFWYNAYFKPRWGLP